MSSDPSRHHLKAPGARVYYEVRGSGPLLLVVGQPMTSGPFGPVADDLAGDHTVITYDPRGVGESTVEDPTQPVTPEMEADDLAMIIREVGLGTADLVGSSGGAVAGLALALRHPDLVGTVIAHEPPLTELLADAPQVRAEIDRIEETYRTSGAGAAWGGFVSLVMHQGPVTEAGVPPATWPPPGADPGPDGGDGENGGDAAAVAPEPSAKQQADDELFFRRMLKPFTRYRPDTDTLATGSPRVVVAVGAASGAEIARRSAEALAERLGVDAVEFPGSHGGFMEDPAAFAAAVRRTL